MSLWPGQLENLLLDLWNSHSKEYIDNTFREHGKSWEAVRKKAKKLGLDPRDRPLSSMNDWPLTQEKDFDEDAALKELLKRGYQLNKLQTITDKVFDLDTNRYNGELVRIGIVSDTHLCSRHQQLTHLKTIYRKFKEEGIKIVLHAGDLVEGIRMYRGWEQEVLFHGADAQAKYVIEHYPREDGITTYLISGNHDASFSTNAGVNVVARVCEARSDMVYLGSYGAYITLPGNLRTYLHHGAGGVAYSRSYKLQKAVENFAPECKPHLYISGHYHITCTLPDFRNVFAMHPGAFQSQTEFLRRLGVSPDVGGWVLEYRTNPNSESFDLTEINAKWIPFRKVIPNDY